ncbi:hypothetical protein NCPPB3923_29215, partial [Burkholderia glumae]
MPGARPATKRDTPRAGRPAAAARAAGLPRAARALVCGLALQFAMTPFAALAAGAAQPGEAGDAQAATRSGDGARSVGAVPA